MAKHGGKYCVAGGPGKVSCTNNTYSEGISMHIFPQDPKVRAAWTRFVRIHRPEFSPTDCSALCSIHFKESCYTRMKLSALLKPIPSLESEDEHETITEEEHSDKGGRKKDRRVLEKGSIPTEHTVNKMPEEPLPSDRDIRKSQAYLREVQREHSCDEESSTSGEDNPVSDFSESDNPCSSSNSCYSDDENEGKSTANKRIQARPKFRSKRVQVSLCKCGKCEHLRHKIRKLQKEKSQLRAQRNRWTQRALYDDTTSESEEEELQKQETNEEQDETDEEELESPGTDEDRDSDPDYCYNLEEEAVEDEEKDTTTRNTISVDKDTPSQKEPMFIVFYSSLIAIFSICCFKCMKEEPEVSVKKDGTMAIIKQKCKICGPEAFVWRSQPLVLGKYPAGNILLSFGILMAGASVTKVLLVLRHMGVCIYNVRTYFQHQKKFLFPAVFSHWEKYRANLLEEVSKLKDVVWSGDGRFDSMGHNAKYGAYTMFCCAISKIVHFEIFQSNQVKSSGDMELRGAQKCFAFLKEAGLAIAVFISDRHRSIAKWIREQQPTTKHFFDIWHVAKSVSKKLLKAGKETGCEFITKWEKSIKNHLYWCATTTKAGFGELIVAKWNSIVRHVTNKHKQHPDPLFKRCVHRAQPRRNWIKMGTTAFYKVKKILMSTRLLNDVKQLSSEDQTSCLEGFHSTLNQFHPKMFAFRWLGTYCRHALASLHFNENLLREPKKTKDGKDYLTVTYPKYKFGEELVREIRVPSTYKYVEDVRDLVFSMSPREREEINSKYKEKVPPPMNTKFPERCKRADAIENYQKRKEKQTAPYPSVDIQDQLQSSANAAKKRKPTGKQTNSRPKKKKTKK